MLNSDCHIYTRIHNYICTAAFKLAISLVGYILNDSIVQLKHRHYASCLAWNFMCAMTLVDHHYCFVLDLFSVSLAAKELTAVSEKWQYIGE